MRPAVPIEDIDIALPGGAADSGFGAREKGRVAVTQRADQPIHLVRDGFFPVAAGLLRASRGGMPCLDELAGPGYRAVARPVTKSRMPSSSPSRRAIRSRRSPI